MASFFFIIMLQWQIRFWAVIMKIKDINRHDNIFHSILRRRHVLPFLQVVGRVLTHHQFAFHVLQPQGPPDNKVQPGLPDVYPWHPSDVLRHQCSPVAILPIRTPNRTVWLSKFWHFGHFAIMHVHSNHLIMSSRHIGQAPSVSIHPSLQ